MTDDRSEAQRNFETAVAIAEQHTGLKNDLRELAERWDDCLAPDQACARELREVLNEY